MGNCCGLVSAKQRRVFWVVRGDGRAIKFHGPVLVKDFLVNFSGLALGVSRESLTHLPSNYELRVGKIYYLLPLPSCPVGITVGASDMPSMAGERERESSGMRRIKVVITKRQLQELLSKKISLEELESQSVDSARSWKPSLESIPEVGE